MTRVLIVEADGGSRGNPGPAAYGAVVRDAASGRVLIECAGSVGHTTNNVAEYQGLIEGLKAARTCDPHARIEARLDSKLVVEQTAGRWKVKNEGLKPLHAEAKALLRELGASASWVPREKNKAADALANAVMDAEAKGRTWVSKLPPVPYEEALDRLGAAAPAGAQPEPEPEPHAPFALPQPSPTAAGISLIAAGFDAATRARLRAALGPLTDLPAPDDADWVRAFRELAAAGRGVHQSVALPAAGIVSIVLRALGAPGDAPLAERLSIAPGTVTTLVVSERGVPVIHHVAAQI